MTLIDRAVAAYGKTNEAQWAFAEIASKVVGLRDGSTQELADRLQHSSDWVEGNASAWRLWEVVQTDTLRNLYFSHWVAVGRKYPKHIGQDEAKDFLQAALDGGWTVDETRREIGRLLSVKGFTQWAYKIAKQADKYLVHGPRDEADVKWERTVADAARFLVEAVDERRLERYGQ